MGECQELCHKQRAGPLFLWMLRDSSLQNTPKRCPLSPVGFFTPLPEVSTHRARGGGALGCPPLWLCGGVSQRICPPAKRAGSAMEKCPRPLIGGGPVGRTLDADLWPLHFRRSSQGFKRFGLLVLIPGQTVKDASPSPVSRLLSRSSCLRAPRGQGRLGTPLPPWLGLLITHSERPLALGH